jgi:hypothetical protein
MSKQWGHGYHSGIDFVIKTQPKHVHFSHVWHWHFKHCWWVNIKRPVRFDVAWPYQINITVLGFTWTLY